MNATEKRIDELEVTVVKLVDAMKTQSKLNTAMHSRVDSLDERLRAREDDNAIIGNLQATIALKP